jgi:zinc protease
MSPGPHSMLAVLLLVLVTLAACGGHPEPAPRPPAAKAPAASPEPDESWRLAIPPPGTPGKLDYPAAEVATLDNGLKIYFVQRPGGLVTTSVVALGGAGGLPLGQSGLAALTVRMMTEGTRDRTSLALAEAVEDLGSSLSQQAGRDHVRVGLTTRSLDFREGLALLAEVVMHPSFDPAELERVRTQWLDELDAERQHPSRLAALAGLRLALGLRAGAPVSGSPADIRRLRRADLVAYHRSVFVPSRMAIAVVGDLEQATVLDAVTQALGGMRGPSRTDAAPAPPNPMEPPGLYVIDRPDAVQTAIFAVHALPRRGEPGFEAREVLNDALGGLFTSRLNQNLREKNAYTYGARSSAISTRHFGVLAVATSVRTDVSTAAVREILAELQALAGEAPVRPLSADEATRAKADLIQSTGARLEQLERMRSDLEELFVHDLPADHYAGYAQRLGAMPLQEIRREARHIAPDRLHVVLVGDRKLLETTLPDLGLRVRDVDPRALE